jgi:hypothetical protein
LKILTYSRVFWPSVGGLETMMEILAEEFSRLKALLRMRGRCCQPWRAAGGDRPLWRYRAQRQSDRDGGSTLLEDDSLRARHRCSAPADLARHSRLNVARRYLDVL